MATPSNEALVKALLDRHGQTYADEIGIKLDKETPEGLFQLLCAAILFSARINAQLAVAAAQALAAQGWTTPEKMLAASWEERTRTLNEAGYARYDERTATMLGDSAQLLVDTYDGDLRKLREAAEHDPASERKLLKEFKGIGDVGVDIFFREVQVLWDELRPFIDKRAAAGAQDLGLPQDAAQLEGLVKQQDFPRLVAALVRVELEHDGDAVRETAAA